MQEKPLKTIAYIHTDFSQKFGLPRQSGLIDELTGYIEFEKGYRNPEAVRGLDGYDYIWLLWGFDVASDEEFKATVRPPRLGGNERMGVFATRSPFRPNHIGLSSVKLTGIEYTKYKGPLLRVSGIDMKDSTPIYDIKPYLSYTDSHEGAKSGFTANLKSSELRVEFPEELLNRIPKDKRSGAIAVLKGDIRPSYHNKREIEKIYGLSYAGHNIRFRVDKDRLIVIDVNDQVLAGE
ncbi:MAG: tRNA (N6-threonylcarbamoyladenosine(37)-N6)-methyltransferase TrmO [Lachnospiraceae bacterium]|nr:tRNA (N6-threonylcarbamoyladenosine(37)-N6)-methyltransferase TrmO [Lachnospiraceae bacterium]